MSLPRMSWHIGDYKKDTGHLRAAGHGAYFLLTMHYWATGGLPDDDKQLAAIACMTDREWKAHRDVLKAFFKGEGGPWKHKRIEEELVDAQEKYEKLSKAGKDGNAKRWGSQRDRPPIRDAIPNELATGSQPITDNQEVRTDANASDASASDPRTQLFRKGLTILANITGKTPNSCRAQVGKWLKSVNDEAIHVLGAIEEAERNRVADPVAWINRVLQSRTPHGQTRSNGLGRALAALGEHLGESDRGEERREAPPRLLSDR